MLIWGSVALCWWEFILRDIYPMGRSQKGFFFAMGLCGVCIVVMELASLAAGRGPLLEEGALTSAGATTLIGCLMASILGAHLGKTAWDKRHPPRGRGVILQLPPRRLAEILANPGKSGIIEGYF